MEMNNFLTLDYLATYTGAVMVTTIMVQFMKELPFIKDIPTRYFTFLIAFINILLCNILTNTFKASNLYLIVVNAVLITLTATGGYDFSVKKVSVKENREE